MEAASAARALAPSTIPSPLTMTGTETVAFTCRTATQSKRRCLVKSLAAGAFVRHRHRRDAQRLGARGELRRALRGRRPPQPHLVTITGILPLLDRDRGGDQAVPPLPAPRISARLTALARPQRPRGPGSRN